MKRFKTDYPGVFYREATRIGGRGKERVYYVVYKKDGKTCEVKAGRQYQNNMTPAKASRFRADLIEGRVPSPKEARETAKAVKEAEADRWTIARLWDLYCETFPDNKGLRFEKRKFDLYLRASVGDKEPPALLALDVDRIRLSLQKKGKRTTAARILELLRRTINFGVKKGLIPPTAFKIEIPRLNNQTTEDLTPAQLKRLIDTLDRDEDQVAANVMRLALFTGMRRSEIFRLKWDNIDSERGFITIEDPKGGRNQTIPLNPSASSIFNGIERREGNPFVFPGRKEGSHLTDCRKSISRIAKAARLPKGFRPLHGLRHVYASMLASSGKVDMYTLQRLLTHKDFSMTQRYAHLRDDALKKAAAVAGDILDGIANGGKDEDADVVNMDKK